MAQKEDIPSFKCILIGDGGTGKSAFLERHLTGEFRKEYMATIGVEIHPLVFYTNKGPIQFNVWCVGGQDKCQGLRECYYLHSECAIVMFDLASKATYESVPYWYRELVHVCGFIPLVICGNKTDIGDTENVKVPSIPFHRKSIRYFDISAKSKYHFEKPFLWLAQMLLDDPNLKFVEAPALFPPNVQIDKDWKIEAEKELQEAQEVVLPKDEKDL